MRALHISQQFPSREYPALGVMVQNAVRAQARQPAMELEVLAPRPYTLPLEGFPYGRLAQLPLRTRDEGVCVHRPHYLYLVPKRWLYPLVGPAFARATRKYAPSLQRPDVIHAHWSYPDGVGAVALRKVFGCPLIVHARGTLERVIARQSPRYRDLVRMPLMAADAVIANSEALREDCLALGVASHKLHVIPNGVDTTLFSPRDKVQLKRELGLDAARLVVLYCGNLRPVKGVDLLAEAIPGLLRDRASLQFVLIGSGELESTLRHSLREQLSHGDVLMLGSKPQREVARYMAAADLLVLPSRSEARSNVIPEALASGTAVAAAAVGGIPEIMDPSHGLLFEPESAAALSEAVRALTADRGQLAELGSRARSYILASDNTWEAHAAKTVSLYQSLL